MKRIAYYDTLKFWAIFIIASTHFIGTFHEVYFNYYTQPPLSFVINGITGKLGVAVLGVIMCALAYQSTTNNPIDYFFARYIYFVIAGAIVNIVYVFTGIYEADLSLKNFLIICFSLSAEIFPTFWCMRAFLFASLLAFIDGKYGVSWQCILFEMSLLWLAGLDWIAICLMGALVANLYRNNRVNKIFAVKYVRVIILIVLFIMIKREESISAFYIDGICTVLLLLVINNSDKLKCLLEKCHISARLGKYTMTIFLVHNGVYKLIGRRLFSIEFISGLKYIIGFLIVFCCCFAITLFIAIPIQLLLDKIMLKIKQIRI